MDHIHVIGLDVRGDNLTIYVHIWMTWCCMRLDITYDVKDKNTQINLTCWSK